MSTFLHQSQVKAMLSPEASVIDVEFVEQTGSTNADLLARLENLDGPCLRCARYQSAGRGRAGRNWLAEPDAALMFSLAWPFHLGMQALIGLPLVVGVVVAERLRQLGVQVELKWPNDILLEGKKLAGILIETSQAQTAFPLVWAVIGVGINLKVPAGFEQTVGRQLAGLESSALDRNRLLAELTNGLASALQVFAREGLAGFTDRWNALHAYRDRLVNILDHNVVTHSGLAQGIDAEGRLLLSTEKGIIAVLAGDVSLRLKE